MKKFDKLEFFDDVNIEIWIYYIFVKVWIVYYWNEIVEVYCVVKELY